MSDIFTKKIMKSVLNVKSEYDKYLILQDAEGFIRVNLSEEDEESLTLDYDIKDKTGFYGIRKLEVTERLKILINLSELIGRDDDYDYDFCPENLYFDLGSGIYILERRIKDSSRVESKGDGLPEYKSLICHSLQDKFRFEDILKGGQDLLIKDEFLGKVLNLATKEEIIEALKERYHEIVSKDAEAYAKVNKKKYKFTKIFCYTVSAIAVILLGFSIYYMFIEKPILKAKVAGEEYYIGSDYGSVIEAMDKVPISKLDLGQKYILAVSYIKSLSLTEQQKQVIIGKMPQNSDELLMEYWIYIGRRDAENAEDVAMREADNELLAYAYMMEYENLLIDTSISGAKKDERLTDLNTTINELTEPYLKMQEEDEAALEEEEEEDAQSILETRLDELEELVETQQKDIKEIKKEQKKTDTTEKTE